MLSRKPNRCKHCKVRFSIEQANYVLHEECKDAWIAAFQEKAKKKAEAKRKIALRVDRALTRERKARLKTIPDLIREAQTVFNEYIRERDHKAGYPCISSGKPLDWSGNEVDAGHFRSRGAAPHLRFHEMNVHAQSKHENRYKSGNALEMRKGIIERYGLAVVEELESNNEVKKWTKQELIQIKATYQRKFKELKA